MEGTILHADADSFFAAVEQRDDPRLRGRPTIVGPGVVMAASYEAKAYGIHGGMGAGKARRLCPDAVFVAPRFEAYSEAGHALFEVFRDTSPVVEGLSIEEAFLDVRGLEHISGSPGDIARRLRRRVRAEVGLPVSVGVARTKILAKMASRQAKPDGLLVVELERELEFLHPIPVAKLWGVGASTAAKLHGRGIMTVGQMALVPQEALMAILGRASGRHLYAIAQNSDPRRVRTRRGRRSVGAQRALGSRPRSEAELDATIVALVDRVTRRMRTKNRVGRTVVLRLRFGDYSRASKSRTLRRPTAATDVVLATARRLLTASQPAIRRRGLTLLGITVTNLDGAGAGVQLEFPFEGSPRVALDAAVDEVRDRFGTDALSRAVVLRRRPEQWLDNRPPPG